mgnify:CR=1 FL=1
MITHLVTKKRKCGKKSPGGVYMVAGEPSSEDGSSPVFTLIVPPVPYQVPVHRGSRLVDDQAILQRMPLEEWWVGTSGRTEEKKRGDAFWVDLFGLPVEKRLNEGVCIGVSDAEEVLATIAGKIKWNGNLVSLFRELTIAHAQNMPNAARYFDGIRTSLVEYTERQTVDALVKAQSQVWGLAGITPKKHKDVVLPVLERMLILMNLPEDALYMDYLYNKE